jgi:excinuclease ABC subunit C
MAKTEKTRAKGAKADAATSDAGAAGVAKETSAKRTGRSTTTARGDTSTAARKGATRTPRTAREEGGAVPGGTEGGTTSTRTVRAAGPRAGVSAAKKAGNARVGNRQDAVRRDSNLRADLREFVSARPKGWNHDQWLGLLDDLRGRGHDVSDASSVGMSLERERLAVQLEQIPGMGPRRVEALVGRYHTLYSLRQADAAELAELPGMNRALAERVHQQFA